MEGSAAHAEQNTVLVLTGPTASGKTELSLCLAATLNAEIISADSMQIYRAYNIATAKIAETQRRGIPHHLIDILEPFESYSVSDFVRDATLLIQEIQQRKKTAIVCGGTNQYVGALLDGLEFVDMKTDPEERARISRKILAMGAEKAHAELAKLDAEAGKRIKPQDIKRITRFFEVYEQSGLTQSEVNRRSRLKGPDFRFRAYALSPERETLYEAINLRVRQMFAKGLVEELRGLLERYPNLENAQSFQAIGYKELLPYLRKEITENEAIELLARNTRRYAKRQLSWIRSRRDLIPIQETETSARLSRILHDLKRFSTKSSEIG